MSSPNQSEFRPVRFSRILPLSRLAAIGASVAVGIGVLTLLGPVFQLTAGSSVLVPYLLLLAMALPFVLTLGERTAVVAGGDAYGLTRRFGILWLIFANGWTQFGGYAAVIALLCWGVALHIQAFFTRGLALDIPSTWLALGVLLVTAVANILGTRANWRRRVTFIYVTLVLFAVLVVALTIALRGTTAPAVLNTASPSLYTAAVVLVSSLWGLYVILGLRDETRRPTRTLPRALGIVVLLVVGLGALTAPLVTQGAALVWTSPTPVLAVSETVIERGNALLPMVYTLFGAGFVLLALSRAFVSALKLLNDMGRDALVPAPLVGSAGQPAVPTRLVLLLTVVSAGLLIWMPLVGIAGLAAIAFLYTAVFILAPDVIRSKPLLPENRQFKLPFHPLVPAIAVAVGGLLPLALSRDVWLPVLGWASLGAVYYLVYGRARGLARRRQELVVEDVKRTAVPAAGYRVLVGIANEERAPMLIRASARIARTRGGEVVAMRILLLADQMPINLKHARAEAELTDLVELIQGLGIDDVVVRPIVRIAPSSLEGILGAITEEEADLLVLGWIAASDPQHHTADSFLNSLINLAPCEVAIVAGDVPERVGRILVPTSGGPNAPAAFGVARAFQQADASERVDVVSVIRGQPTPEQADRARDLLSETFAEDEAGEGVNGRVVAADSVRERLVHEARDHDLVVMGIGREGPVNRSFFGGMPVQVAVETDRPAILVRASEGQSSAWLARIWALVSDPLPTLTEVQRTAVAKDMRQSAVPTVDFFVLILLSSMIASLGLLQNSAAVIIGAMLVAPLMSPILSMAMAIVLGEIPMLWQGAEATVKGVALAIFVGLVMVIISPIDSATNEILARTQPNILDLMVALASGAAAGYALSRKEVAAALPGVAIAAALVPPLCVVGYGLGTAQLSYATGALLLFVTNLLAIVLSAALVFLALGFEPRRDREEELVRGLRITAVLLSIVAGVLVIATIATVQQLNRQVNVERVLRDEVVERVAEVEEVTVTQQGDVYLIETTIRTYAGALLTPEELRQLESDLAEAAGGPVEVDAIVVEAIRSDFEDAALIRELDDTLRAFAEASDVIVLDSLVQRKGNAFWVQATVVLTPDTSLDALAMDELQAELTAVAEAPITFEITAVDGVFVETTAVPTPTVSSP